MSRRVVTANLSGNGVPSLRGDVVMTQETGSYDGPLDYRGARAGELGIFWDPNRVEVVETGHRRLCRSGRAYGLRNFGPTRYALYVVTKSGTAFVNVHLTQDAWADRPVSHARLRRRLWNRSMRRVRQLVADLEARGCRVVLGGDFNRKHDEFAAETGISDVRSRGIGYDRFFWDGGALLKYGRVEIGGRMGHGGHTHSAYSIALIGVDGSDA